MNHIIFRLAVISYHYSFSKMAITDNDTIIDQTLSEKLVAKGQKSPFLIASMWPFLKHIPKM